MTQISVIKHQGKRSSEAFNPAKLLASIEAACHSVRLPEGVAHDTAEHTRKAVELWLRGKAEVTSDDIRRKATATLTLVSPEAGYLYKHHNTIL